MVQDDDVRRHSDLSRAGWQLITYDPRDRAAPCRQVLAWPRDHDPMGSQLEIDGSTIAFVSPPDGDKDDQKNIN
jgi:hypothetical protein